VAHLEADIPKQIEDVLHQLAERLGELGRGARQQKQEVDVGPRIQGAAAVAAGGDEGDGQQFTAFPGVERGFKDRADYGIDQLAAGACDFQAAGSRAVVEQDPVFLGFQKPLVERDPLGGRKLALQRGLECLAGVFFEVVEMMLHAESS